MRRRQFLLSLGSAGPLLSASGLRDLGIRTVVFRRRTRQDAARRIHAAGLRSVQLGLHFADAGFSVPEPDWDWARQTRDIFLGAGLRIVGLDGYVNLVHPDPAERRRNIEGLSSLLEHARDFGTTVVATEAGTFHPGERYRPYAEDREKGWEVLVSGISDLVRVAEASGTYLALEPSFATCVGTVEETARLLEAVPSPHLKILWDAAHLVHYSDYEDTTSLLQRSFDAFGSKVVLAHANDVCLVSDDRTWSCRAGTGRLDYAVFVQLLGRIHPPVSLCLEHVTEDELDQALDYLGRF